MQTRRDQLHAHVFVVGRLVSALVRADPDQPERPMRRTAAGGVIGAVIGLTVLVGFGIYGMVSKGGGDSWKDPNAIIIEEESGARFVYLDNTLRPVLNYTSARLAAGGDKAVVRRTSRASLAAVPRGRPIGIPDAPDNLPDPKSLRADPWLVCTGDAGSVTVAIGGGWAATDLPADQGALVSADKRKRYLVTRNRRLPIPDAGTVEALGYGKNKPLPVTSAWLNAFDEGPALRAPDVPGRGEAGEPVAGQDTEVGEVFQMQIVGGRSEYFLMMTDGLLPVSATVAALVLADPEADGDELRQTTPAGIAGVGRSARTLPVDGYPETPPALVAGLDSGRALCVRETFAADRGPAVALTTVDAAQAATGTPSGSTDGRVADRVAVPPGTGTLVTGVPSGTAYLITDLGVKYPMPGDDVISALGYAQAPRVPVPTTLLALLPTGSVLDPQAARTELSSSR